MNFKELSAKIADAHGITKRKAESIVKQLFETVRDEITTGGEVSIHGFGRFTARTAAPRLGRNVTTGVEMDIPARIVPKFVAHTALKEAFNTL